MGIRDKGKKKKHKKFILRSSRAQQIGSPRRDLLEWNSVEAQTVPEGEWAE